MTVIGIQIAPLCTHLAFSGFDLISITYKIIYFLYETCRIDDTELDCVNVSLKYCNAQLQTTISKDSPMVRPKSAKTSCEFADEVASCKLNPKQTFV